MKKINKKIPGRLPPPPRNEVDGKITNLTTKTIPELLELRDRQLKLLENKSFLSKLPDKGSKIQGFYDKIIYELITKQNEEHACRMLENLKLNHIDKNSIDNIEWHGKFENLKESHLDSDDDSEPEDLLHILSQSTAKEKKIKTIQPDKPLILPEDLAKIDETPHIKYIVDITEDPAKNNSNRQFKPYKTTKSDCHNPEKEILRKKHKTWEVTAATPPPIIHGPAKVLNLEESLKLQKEYNMHLKKIEVQHAAEKLLARTGIKMDHLPENISKFGSYREVDSDDSEDSDNEGSDKEIHDEEPERGGVVFTVMK